MDPVSSEGVEAFSGDYRIIALDQPLSLKFREEYWSKVKQVLRDVFQGDESKADAVRKELEKRSNQPQTMFYHADPFEIAADLAGRSGQEITPSEKALYQAVLRQQESHVNATHPEDA